MYDLLITNALIVDGTGDAAHKGDVAVSGDRIVAVGNLSGAPARQVINANGRVTSPGFIDTHSHSDSIYLLNPKAESKVMQGVTTEVTGQCGSQSAPLYGLARSEFVKYARQYGVAPETVEWETYDQFCSVLQQNGAALNVAPLIGHSTIRAGVIGFDQRKPTAAELDRMVQITGECMQQGAFGISTGLIYPPGCYGDVDEISELVKVVAKYGGIYATHMRSEMDGLFESVEETIEVGKRSGATVLISHHKSSGRNNWGKVKKTTQMMDGYRQKHGRIYCDVYPYTAGSTGLSSLIPSWAHDGGVGKLLVRLGDAKTRETIKQQMETGCPGWERLTAAGYDNIYVTSVKSEQNKGFEGKNIAQIAAERGVLDPRDMVIELLVEEQAAVSMVLFMMCDEDVAHVVKYPFAAIGSDASAIAPHGPTAKGKPHPRAYGTFARVLAKFVREEGHLSLEEAVRKMTSMPAEIVGLSDRGLVAPGKIADLLIFDPGAVKDNATFADPHQLASGFDWVIVNGVPVVEEGRQNDRLPGRILRKQV